MGPPHETEPCPQIRAFLALALESAGTVAEREGALAQALDRLALAAHGPRPEGPETQLLPPSLELRELRARIAARFPGLGLYREGSLGLDGGHDFLVGDAIDDLLDIVAELTGVLWLAEHSGRDDALWQFHFGFESHWGSHLRQLQWVLHERAQERRLAPGDS